MNPSDSAPRDGFFDDGPLDHASGLQSVAERHGVSLDAVRHLVQALETVQRLLPVLCQAPHCLTPEQVVAIASQEQAAILHRLGDENAPVKKPRPSGEYGTNPMPSSRTAANTPLSSGSRDHQTAVRRCLLPDRPRACRNA